MMEFWELKLKTPVWALTFFSWVLWTVCHFMSSTDRCQDWKITKWRLILQLWPSFLNFHKNSPIVLEIILFVWTSEFLNFQKNSLQTGAVVLFVWTFFMSEKERKFRQIVYTLFISDYLYELQIFSSWNHKRKWKWPLNRAKSNDDISRTLSWTTLTKDDPSI